MSVDLPLRDIHLPAEPGWWPPAPGWWALAIVLIALTWWLGRCARAAARRRRQRQRLMRAFDAILDRHPPEARPAQLLGELSQLMRRAALRHSPQGALLSGEDWLRHLDGEDAARPFSAGPGRLLLEGPYQPNVSSEAVHAALPLLRRRLRDWAEQGDA